jgi:hypothetical protein
VTNSCDDTTSSSRTSAAALALFASSVGDPAGTRTITAIVVLLAVLGVALVMIAFWLFRVTRPDKELLAPLEVMGERKWRRADPVWQRRRLDEVRPADAQPMQPSAAPPDFDEAFFERAPAARGFEDLHDDAHPNGASTDADADAEGDAEVVLAAPATVDSGSANGAPLAVETPQAPAQLKPVSPTPIGIERPLDLPERDIDPELMAAALAELDAELQSGRQQRSQAPD